MDAADPPAVLAAVEAAEDPEAVAAPAAAEEVVAAVDPPEAVKTTATTTRVFNLGAVLIGIQFLFYLDFLLVIFFFSFHHMFLPLIHSTYGIQPYVFIYSIIHYNAVFETLLNQFEIFEKKK